MKAIIIGAGIGGLCTAIALQNIGVQVSVFEQADEPRAAGAGLTLWQNATHALHKLGIDPMQHGIAFDGGLRRADGVMLSWIEPRKMQARFGGLTVAVHRVDLMHALLDKVGDVVHYGKRLARYEQTGAIVSVRFTDNTTVEGDLLIGADGINSVVRSQMQPDSQPIYRGYPAWRGVAEFSHAHQIWGETWGRGARFGIMPVSKGRVYWFATANRPVNAPPTVHRPMLRDLFSDWHDPIPTLIEATPDSALLYNDIADLEPLSSWIEGRVVLLGDAAHAMTPNMGQGACQAIEDAVALADTIQQNTTIGDALHAYESQRLPHTRRVVLRSRAIGRMGQLQNPALVMLRNTITRLTPDDVTLRGLDFLM